jgi:hypothetical protein
MKKARYALLFYRLKLIMGKFFFGSFSGGRWALDRGGPTYISSQKSIVVLVSLDVPSPSVLEQQRTMPRRQGLVQSASGIQDACCSIGNHLPLSLADARTI